MFGLRYHVASLAAVFVALAVGILLGVAISGRVTDASEGLEEELLRNENERLGDELESARAGVEAATRQNETSEELVARTYPALMDGRLEGTSVAVVYLGHADGSLRAEVEGALADADGGAPARVVALEVPVDADELSSALEGEELLAGYADGDDDFSDLGRALGRELVDGGDAEVWTALASRLVEERTGTSSLPADAVVVAKTWLASEAADGEEDPEVRATASLLEGLVAGVDDTGVPVVGVTATGGPQELLEFYRDEGISIVDHVDTQPGRLALALLLAGAPPGHYGLDEEADAVVPPVEPLEPEGD